MKKQLLSLLLSIFLISPIFAASAPSLDHLDYDIKSSIESKCSYAKMVEGPAKYIACLNKNLSELGNQKIPSLSHLDYDIKSSIESKCSYAKMVEGPAKYIACLNKNLSELGNQKIPSLSHLDYDIKSSIESKCSYAKMVEGPAKYIACLNNQLRELNSITDSSQNTKVISQIENLSYKDMKLADAINYIQNGESHQIWLSLASDGLDNAQYILGVLYIKGIGVSKSMKEAAYWINLARQNGSMDISYEADEVWNEFELWKYE